MKIVFEYIYRDTCYGEVRIENERHVEANVDTRAEIRLPPCTKAATVTAAGECAHIKFADGGEVTVSSARKAFTYEESYSLFEDLRHMELSGTVELVRT